MIRPRRAPTEDSASISSPVLDGKGDGSTAHGRPEAHLVERARRGDREAFGELYRLFHAAVLRMARFHLGEAGEDAAAETFVRAWAALPRYRVTGAPFVAWLYGIARHVVADELRGRRRVEPRERMPDRAVEDSPDDRLALAAAVASLPEEQRRVIEMKFLLGLGNREVGAVLGKSPGAVNAQQWRALETLRRSLG